MMKFRYKAVETAAGLIAGIALTVPAGALPASAASAAALPGAEVVAATTAAAPGSAPALPPSPMRLKAALLKASDLPRGYAPTTSDSLATVSQIGTDTNICDHRVTSHGPVSTAQAAFIRGLPGPMLFETLSATGPRTARAIVSGIAAAPRICRSIKGSHGDGMDMRIYPLRAPRLGDASAGVRFVIQPPATNMTISGSLISVARGSVAATILLINPQGGGQRELNQIATTAIRKLDHVL